MYSSYFFLHHTTERGRKECVCVCVWGGGGGGGGEIHVGVEDLEVKKNEQAGDQRKGGRE